MATVPVPHRLLIFPVMGTTLGRSLSSANFSCQVRFCFMREYRRVNDPPYICGIPAGQRPALHPDGGGLRGGWFRRFGGFQGFGF